MADLKCLASMLNSISIMGIIYEGWDDWSVFSESKPRCDWYLCEWHEGYRFTRSTCFPSSFLLALRCVLVLFCPPTPSLPLQRCTECCRKAQECHCVGYQRESESVQPIPLKLSTSTAGRDCWTVEYCRGAAAEDTVLWVLQSFNILPVVRGHLWLNRRRNTSTSYHAGNHMACLIQHLHDHSEIM